MKPGKGKPKFAKLLSFLRVRTSAAGLEVSDQVLRLAYSNGKEWKTAAVVLGPGIMERGAVKDAAAFSQAVAALRAKVPALRRRSKRMTAVVSLGSANIYTQSFALPFMEGDELKKAIDLNIQMSAPDDLSKSYYGAQVLAEDKANGRIEVSAAFIERKLVDDVVEPLFAGGFVTINVESRALSLVRILRERAASFDPSKSYIFFEVDNGGMDFLIVRGGRLYFEYAVPWRDVADPKGEVSKEKFGEAASVNLRQVFNFYHQHWQEALGGVIVSSPVFGEEAVKAAADASGGVPVAPLSFAPGREVAAEWLAATGAGMRDADAASDGVGEINLAGDVAAERYAEQRLIDFLELWQVIVPATLAICVVTLALAFNFLTASQTELAENEAASAGGAQAAETAALDASSTAFNQEVELALAAESNVDVSHALLDALDTMAATSSVSLSTVSFQGVSSPIQLSGTALTEDDIGNFRDLISADPRFTGVNLPLSQVQPAGTGYSFSMTFQLAPSAFRQ